MPHVKTTAGIFTLKSSGGLYTCCTLNSPEHQLTRHIGNSLEFVICQHGIWACICSYSANAVIGQMMFYEQFFDSKVILQIKNKSIKNKSMHAFLHTTTLCSATILKCNKTHAVAWEALTLPGHCLLLLQKESCCQALLHLLHHFQKVQVHLRHFHLLCTSEQSQAGCFLSF